MPREKITDKLNEQFRKELFSAYYYLGMASYFYSVNLDGFANFFRVQVQEERDHAMAFFDFTNKIGGKARMGAIEEPKQDFASPQEIFELAYQHEQFVTQSIYDLMDTAQEVNDRMTQVFLQWFISEQAEEEESMNKILNKLKLIKEDGAGLFMIDNELAQRTYVAANIPI